MSNQMVVNELYGSRNENTDAPVVYPSVNKKRSTRTSNDIEENIVLHLPKKSIRKGEVCNFTTMEDLYMSQTKAYLNIIYIRSINSISISLFR